MDELERVASCGLLSTWSATSTLILHLCCTPQSIDPPGFRETTDTTYPAASIISLHVLIFIKHRDLPLFLIIHFREFQIRSCMIVSIVAHSPEKKNKESRGN